MQGAAGILETGSSIQLASAQKAPLRTAHLHAFRLAAFSQMLHILGCHKMVMGYRGVARHKQHPDGGVRRTTSCALRGLWRLLHFEEAGLHFSCLGGASWICYKLRGSNTVRRGMF